MWTLHAMTAHPNASEFNTSQGNQIKSVANSMAQCWCIDHLITIINRWAEVQWIYCDIFCNYINMAIEAAIPELSCHVFNPVEWNLPKA